MVKGTASQVAVFASSSTLRETVEKGLANASAVEKGRASKNLSLFSSSPVRVLPAHRGTWGPPTATMASDKIKGKDLSYDSTLPPFLQRLHAQKAGFGDQDRHETQVARPKRAKAHDDEDEPTVIDESGETVTKAELEKMTATESSDPVAEGGNVSGTLESNGEAMMSGALQSGNASQKVDQKVTDGTATKKRKVAKVVGEEPESSQKDEAGPTVKKTAKKAKKSKPIKLAFDDGDET